MTKIKRNNVPALGPALGALAARECRSLQRALAMRKKRQEGIHEARKSCRRLRCQLSLLPPDQPIDALDQSLKKLARDFAPLRDAYIAVRTARVLAGEHASRFPASIIEALEKRYEHMLESALEDDPNWRHKRVEAQRIMTAIDALSWQDVRPSATRKTLKRSKRKVKKARKEALAQHTAPTLHAWRRRARKLRYQLESLRKARRMAGMKKRRTKRYGELIKQLTALADQLGWRQDFQVFLKSIEQLPDSRDVQVLRRELKSKSASWSKSEPQPSPA